MAYRRRLFYLHGKLHRIVRIIRPLDMVECWDYEAGKLVAYPWSLTKKQMGKAYSTKEVGKLVNRHMVYIRTLVKDGKVRGPGKTYGLKHYYEDEPTEYARKQFGDDRHGGRYWWGDEHILELHDFMLSTHFGRPRVDGRIMPKKDIPSRRELLAKLRNETVLYVKSEDGFEPVWKESDFGR